MDLELTQIHEYKVFKDTGKAQFHNGKVITPDGFQKIRVHFVYAVKHDGRFKARLVADGHLTKEPVESIYSGVVSLTNMNTRFSRTRHCNRDLPVISIFHTKKIKGFSL